MNWYVLGLEQTTDTEQIKKAYRVRLKETNPEEKPEEFKALRAAYEEAMQYAKEHADDNGEDDAAELSGVERWKKELAALYNDFQRRIDVEEWKKLFADELCMSLDTRSEVEDALLHFLMEHYFLSQEVWQLFDKEFRFEERKNELVERYPNDFLEFAVISGIHYPEFLPVQMFKPGVNGAACEEYTAVYREVLNAEGADRITAVEKLRALPESHPYGEALVYRILGEDDRDKTIEALKALCEKYPGDTRLVENLAGVYLEAERFKECEAVCKEAERTISIDWLRAQSLAKQERYEEGIDLLSELITQSDHNPAQSRFLVETRGEWSKLYMEQLLVKHEAEPDNAEHVLSLGWCCLEHDDLDAAAKWGEKLSPETIHPIDYYHFTSLVCLETGKINEAAEATEKMLALVESLTEEDALYPKWSKRVFEVYARLAKCKEELGFKEEACALYHKALEIKPTDGYCRTSLCALLMREKDYPELLENAREMLKIESRDQSALYFNCMALAEMHRDQEAFEAVNYALQINPTSLDLYYIKGKILIRNHAFEQAAAMLDYLKEREAGEFADVKALDAMLLEEQNPDTEDEAIKAELIKRYSEVLDMADAGEHVADAADICYRMACIVGNEKEPNAKKIRLHLEKGLSFDPLHFNCLSYKAWLYKRENKTKEALELYHRLEKLKRNNLYIEEQLASTYYTELTDSADKAFHYYEMLANADESADHLFHAGVCTQYLQENEKALEIFKRLGEADPEGVDAPFRCAKVLAAMGRWDEAMEYIEKAIAVPDDRKKDPTSMHFYKVLLLCRKDRFDEALDYLNKMIGDYPDFENALSEQMTILQRTDKTDKIEELFRIWKKSGAEKDAYYEKYLLQCFKDKDRQEIKRLLTWHQKDLNAYNKQRAKRYVDYLEGDFKGLLKSAEEELKRARAEGKWNNDYESELIRVMWAQWLNDKVRDAAQTAEEIYRHQLDKMKQFSLDKTMTCTRVITVLAMLGRFDEAREMLDRVRSMPLCQYCAYNGCKDADIYEVQMLMVEGRLDEAYEKAAAFYEKWPDETDFLEFMLYLEKRSKKK